MSFVIFILCLLFELNDSTKCTAPDPNKFPLRWKNRVSSICGNCITRIFDFWPHASTESGSWLHGWREERPRPYTFWILLQTSKLFWQIWRPITNTIPLGCDMSQMRHMHWHGIFSDNLKGIEYKGLLSSDTIQTLPLQECLISNTNTGPTVPCEKPHCTTVKPVNCGEHGTNINAVGKQCTPHINPTHS